MLIAEAAYGKSLAYAFGWGGLVFPDWWRSFVSTFGLSAAVKTFVQPIGTAVAFWIVMKRLMPQFSQSFMDLFLGLIVCVTLAFMISVLVWGIESAFYGKTPPPMGLIDSKHIVLPGAILGFLVCLAYMAKGTRLRRVES